MTGNKETTPYKIGKRKNSMVGKEVWAKGEAIEEGKLPDGRPTVLVKYGYVQIWIIRENVKIEKKRKRVEPL